MKVEEFSKQKTKGILWQQINTLGKRFLLEITLGDINRLRKS